MIILIQACDIHISKINEKFLQMKIFMLHYIVYSTDEMFQEILKVLFHYKILSIVLGNKKSPLPDAWSFKGQIHE